MFSPQGGMPNGPPMPPEGMGEIFDLQGGMPNNPPMPPPGNISRDSISFQPSQVSVDEWISLGMYVAVLLFGLAFATFYKRENLFKYRHRLLPPNGTMAIKNSGRQKRVVASKLDTKDWNIE